MTILLNLFLEKCRLCKQERDMVRVCAGGGGGGRRDIARRKAVYKIVYMCLIPVNFNC